MAGLGVLRVPYARPERHFYAVGLAAETALAPGPERDLHAVAVRPAEAALAPRGVEFDARGHRATSHSPGPRRWSAGAAGTAAHPPSGLAGSPRQAYSPLPHQGSRETCRTFAPP